MKNILKTFALFFAFAAYQSCSNKVKDTSVVSADAIEMEATTVSSERIAARRAELAKATAERNEKRKLAAKELAAASATYQNDQGKIVYRQVDTAPYYTGGDDAMIKYLNDNLQYPQEAKDKGVEGTVYVDFVVEEDGTVKDVVASDFIGDDFDQLLKDESVRVVSSMPAWTAGRHKGKNVNTAFSIPITFRLSN